jgi:predicted GNAT family acetyltransferase
MAQTLWDSITEFLSPEAGQRRRAALDEFGRDIGYYVPPEMRGLLGFAAEMTPTASLERAGQASERMFDADRTAMERAGDLGAMLSETAGVAAPMMVAPRAGMTAAQAVQEGLLGASVAADDVGRRFVDRMNQPGPVPTMYSNPIMRAADDGFDVSRRDASNIFGEGSERVRYTDPNSGGTIEVAVRPDGGASVLELDVPEAFRGKGIGQSLQQRVMEDFPKMGGQVSSKAAAKTAYRLGRRPYGQPDATLDDVFAAIDDMSSTNLVSPQMQPNPAQEVAGLLSSGRADEVTDEMLAKFTPKDEMELFDLYQRGATGMDLPMDEASRMQRAREMGFDTDTPLFHGTDTLRIDAFDPDKGMEGLPATFFSDNREVAQSYGDVGEYFANVSEPAEFDFGGGSTTSFNNETLTPGGLVRRVKDVRDDAQNYGIDSESDLGFDLEGAGPGVMYADEIDAVKMRNVVDSFDWSGPEANNLAVFDPENIRRINARFDPRLAHLRNLSAGVAGGGLLATQDTEQQREEEIRQYLGGLL